MDIIEEMDKYAGKVVRFTGLTAVSDRLPTGCFLAGRHVMTCCAEDIAYSALACEWDAGLIKANLQHRAWAQVSAKVELRHHTVYGRKGPVLKVISAGPGKKPAQEVATFY